MLYIQNRNAADFISQHPQAVETIVNNHYVDDFVCSFKSQQEAKDVSEDIIKIHAQARFELRGFVFNVAEVQAYLNKKPFSNANAVN